jgi:hypothetical protein
VKKFKEMWIMKMRRDILLKGIADLLITFENPTGNNCSNDIYCVIGIKEERYVFDGEKFVRFE